MEKKSDNSTSKDPKKLRGRFGEKSVAIIKDIVGKSEASSRAVKLHGAAPVTIKRNPEEMVENKTDGDEKLGDEEYRRLNDQLREKEYQIRKLMESQKLGQSQISHQQAQFDKVEKVSQGARKRRNKSSRDSAVTNAERRTCHDCDISNKFSDIETQLQHPLPSPPPPQKLSLQQPPKTGGLLRLSAPLNKDVMVGKTDIHDSNKSTQKEKTIERKADAASCPKTWQQRQPREGVDIPRAKKKHNPLTLSLSAEELAEQKANALRRDLERQFQKMKSSESAVQRAFDGLRWDPSLVQDFCLLGPAIGAPQLHSEMTELDTLYCEVLRTAPESWAEHKVPQKLWVMRLRLLEIFQIVLSKRSFVITTESGERTSGLENSQTATLDKSQLSQIGAIYARELNAAIQKVHQTLTCILSTVGNVNIPRNMSDPTSTANEAINSVSPAFSSSDKDHDRRPNNRTMSLLREAAQCLCIAMGDLLRFKDSFEAKNSSKDKLKGSATDTSLPERVGLLTNAPHYYWMALSLAPWCGAPFKPLASLAHRQGDIYQAAYLLIRSMCVSQPYDARELLLGIFEEQREAAERLSQATALSALSTGDHISRFRAHMLACAGIAYTRTGADRLTGHMEKARRHMASLLQMLASEASEARGGAKSGQFFEFTSTLVGQSNDMVAASGADESVGAGAGAYLNSRAAQLASELDEEWYKAIVMGIALLRIICVKHDFKSIVSEATWADAVHDARAQDPPSDHDGSPSEEEMMCAKRYLSQRLHKLLVIPGFVDVSRLVLALVTTLLLSGCEAPSLAAGSAISSVQSFAGIARLTATLRAVSVFFTWLKGSQEYHILSLMDPTAWSQIETATVPYFNAVKPRGLRSLLPSSSLPPEDVPGDNLLWEDVDLVGFLPIDGVLSTRRHSCKEEKHSNQANVKGSSDSDKLTATISAINGPDATALTQLISQLSQLSIDPVSSSLTSSLIDPTSPAVLGKVAPNDASTHAVTVPEFHRRLLGSSVLSRASRYRTTISNLSIVDVVLGTCNSPTGSGGLFFSENRQPMPPPSLTSSHNAQRLKVLMVRPQLDALNAAQSLSAKSVADVKTHRAGKKTISSTALLSAEEFRRIFPETTAGGAKVSDVEGDLTNAADVEEEGSSVESGGDECEEEEEGNEEGEGDGVVNNEDIEGEQVSSTMDGMSKANDYNEKGDADVSLLTKSLGGISVSNDDGTTKGQKRGLLKVPMRITTAASTASQPSKKTAKDRKRRNHSNAVVASQTGAPINRQVPNKLRVGLTNTDSLPLIVVDAPNVAMRHGLKSRFSCRGVKLAVDFFLSQGHKVVSFLPDYYLDYDRIGELRRLAKLDMGNVREAQIPDDISLLRKMVEDGHIVGTPPQDYDDSYCITYARRHNGYVVTNDLYRDHVARIENRKTREELRSWIKAHCISYTFVGDEFLPNPDASFER